MRDYADFWELTNYMNEVFKGGLTAREVACYASVYYQDYLRSLELHKPQAILILVIERLEEDGTDEADSWLEKILVGLRQEVQNEMD